jgi:hypothetical protein
MPAVVVDMYLHWCPPLCYIVTFHAGITPPGMSGPEADDVMPAAVGVGFTDVGSGQPGTDRWAGSFIVISFMML